MIGTRTNVVASVEVTGSRQNDSPMLPALLETSAKRFTMKRVSADKGYLSEENAQAIVNLGAEPFVPPKVNTAFSRPNDASRKKLAAWDKMLGYYQYRRDDFLKFYHRRSNVETTFSMIKTKVW